MESKRELIPLDEPKETDESAAKPPRGYDGVRITAPQRDAAKAPGTMFRLPANAIKAEQERQARILTGAALLGIIATVLIHEFGHWVTGLALTGKVPDFYVVAVRQKTDAFSTSEGVLIWLAGPVFHMAMLWTMVLLAPVSGRYSTRLIAASGAALVFTIILVAATWAFSAFSASADWGDDLPKVASFFSSDQRMWMHVLEAAFMTGVLAATGYWLWSMRRRHNAAVFAGPIAVGVIEGGVFVLIGAWFVALML